MSDEMHLAARSLDDLDGARGSAREREGPLAAPRSDAVAAVMLRRDQRIARVVGIERAEGVAQETPLTRARARAMQRDDRRAGVFVVQSHHRSFSPRD